MSKITRFVSKDERVAKAKAEVARQAVLDLDLPPMATEDMMIIIARHEDGGQLVNWRFVMISPAQCLAVWEAIRDLPANDRPKQVRHIFDYILTHVEVNTGAVVLTREELAEKINAEPCTVSTLMGTLEKMGVIYRRRIKVSGMRGPGMVRYYLNPHVAWNDKLERREVAAKQVPLPFAVIDGGQTK